MSIVIPSDFQAVVFTAPAQMNATTIADLTRAIERAELPNIPGDRILHLHQVESMDASTVVTLIDLVKKVESRGSRVLLCDPPPLVRSYLEFYGVGELMRDRVLSSEPDGTYLPGLLSFVPPFVPHGKGRFDIYERGRVKSFELAADKLSPIAAVDLAKHTPRAPSRASKMQVLQQGQPQVLASGGYVLLRRHDCGCDATHAKFRQLHALHTWFRRKGFDFLAIELWASDVPAGRVTEKITFRDRPHFEQFVTLLKIDESWQELAAGNESAEEEYYYQYG